ncbi:CC_3452 family protein [Novosphingobium sp.]|uniref:CC_3452 family protein n=1 Tax=Novosphingobium sp. TaxID=1874826 RepID=UPI0038BC2C40
MNVNQTGALRQILPAALALVLSATGFAMTAMPVHAEGTSYYTAALATPLAAPKTVIHDELLWHCAGAECTAPRGSSRPAVVCARLVRSLGPVTHFATPQGDLAAEDLARCNGTKG